MSFRDRSPWFWCLLFVALAAILWGTRLLAAAESDIVDVDLVLAVDISQSMDEHEQKVQRAGYVEAIRSKYVVQAIRAGEHGKIALTYVEWGGKGEQFVVIPKRIIASQADADAFATELSAKPVQTVQRTALGDALLFSANLFTVYPMQATRRVIDVSGDGPNNMGTPMLVARKSVIDQGIVINGLPLMLQEGSSWFHLPNLDEYFDKCVIGGEGSFFIPIRSVEDFASGIQMKLVLEIAGVVPEKSLVVPVQAPMGQPPFNLCTMHD